MPENSRKPGRPSLFNEEIAETLFQRLSDGESLRTICEDEDMPARKTVRQWAYRNPAFADHYARARVEGMFALAEDALHRAKTCSPEEASSTRVYVDTVKWFASKMAPGAFGDKSTIDLHATTKSEDEQPVTLLQLSRELVFAVHLGLVEAAKQAADPAAEDA